MLVDRKDVSERKGESESKRVDPIRGPVDEGKDLKDHRDSRVVDHVSRSPNAVVKIDRRLYWIALRCRRKR